MKTRKLGIGIVTGAAALLLLGASVRSQTQQPAVNAGNQIQTAQTVNPYCPWGFAPGAGKDGAGFGPWAGARGMMGPGAGMMGPRGFGMRGGMMGPGAGMMGPRGFGMRGGMMGPGAGMMGHGFGMMGPGLTTIADKIDWQVRLTDTGAETLLTSDDPNVVPAIQAYAQQAAWRLRAGATMRWWDPLFEDLSTHADEIRVTATNTDKGARIVATGTTSDAVALVQAYTKVVDDFFKNGWAEMQKTHPSPLRSE